MSSSSYLANLFCLHTYALEIESTPRHLLVTGRRSSSTTRGQGNLDARGMQRAFSDVWRSCGESNHFPRLQIFVLKNTKKISSCKPARVMRRYSREIRAACDHSPTLKDAQRARTTSGKAAEGVNLLLSA